MASITCVVVTPEETVLEQEATFVALPLFDGEIGISPGHSPMIGRLGYGELRLASDDSTDYFYVDGGFVQVADNVITVLTAAATAAAEIDVPRAEAAIQTAKESKAYGFDAIELRDRTVARNRAQLKVAKRT